MELPETIKVRIRSEGVDKTPLGYITFVDPNTKKLRKQESWSKWGDSYLGEVANIPKAGFKLENTVKRSAEWFGSGRTMFRIQHPDNFLFEITSDNFSEIARSSAIVKGEITTPCILAWEGANLSLIPTDSELYQEQLKLKAVVDAGYVRDFTVGRPYKDKNGHIVGYYGGSQIIATVKSRYVGWGVASDVTVTFSIVSIFHSYHHYNNGHDISYHFNAWVNPYLFECTSEEITEYEKINIFDRKAIQDIDTFNSTYIQYCQYRLFPETADTAYFETLCHAKCGNNINIEIKYNKISDRYLNFRNQKQGD